MTLGGKEFRVLPTIGPDSHVTQQVQKSSLMMAIGVETCRSGRVIK
jgi:hypothetical protein